jgi:Tol biopolymer transport system component
MDETTISKPPSETPVEDRLDSWKEIAAYLNRDVTTVQRWEKREGMPIHRHLHDRMGSVYASRTELDGWQRSRNLHETQERNTAVSPPVSPGLRQKPDSPWQFVLPLAAMAAILVGIILWLQHSERFWRNPIANARFQAVTDFDGVEQSVAISRDGHFIAFLSNRDGPMDVWVTQVGSREFHNLTHGTAPELINPSIRTLGFSPDGSLVTFWVRKHDGVNRGDISIWAVPTLGGQPRPYLEGVAEYAWSPDGSQLAFHTPGPGDPLYVSDGNHKPEGPPVFTAPAGLHSHFPLWSPDGKCIYFVQGTLPDQLDIWRISASGGKADRITSHNGHFTYPVFLDKHTLLYLASDADGSGPWIYSIDIDHRIPHRLSSGLDRYTSLAATADGHRLVATSTDLKRTFWRLAFSDSSSNVRVPVPVSLTTTTGSFPRFGPGYLIYVSTAGTGDSIWKLAEGTGTELWRGEEAQLIGSPAISRDGQRIAFSIRQRDLTSLYVMQSDGTSVQVVSSALNLQGSPAWASDGQSLITAATDHGVPHLFRVPLNGGSSTVVVNEYSIDPAWSPDGRFLVYSGPDIGTTFSLKAVAANVAAHPIPALTLTRGARHLVFTPEGHSVVLLRGEIQHKNLWLINLETGIERQLTNLAPDFDVRDFDISPDGREFVLERVQERSDVVLLDIARQ